MDELVFPREFTRVARWAADRTALVDHAEGTRTTFGEHHTRVARLAAALRDRLGLKPGDRFSALLDNRAVYAELWHAGSAGRGCSRASTRGSGSTSCATRCATPGPG